MKISKNISIATSVALVSCLALVGCGGGGSTTSSTDNSVELSKVTGEVTASKFENAKVYIDLDFSGNYTAGEPTALTDKDGKFTLDYILDGAEYPLIAEGQEGTIRHKDDGTDQNTTDFMMFSTVSEAGASSINPATFQAFLASQHGLDINASFLDSNLSVADMFDNFIMGEKATYQAKLTDIVKVLKQKNLNKSLTTTKEDLDLSSDTTLVFDNTDSNSSTLAASVEYKTKTIPAVIGNLVISNPLVEVEVIDENLTTVDTNITDVTASSVDTTATTTENSIILKKPIFAVVSDMSNKIKVVIGNKSNIQDLGDITLSVTPYKDILSIPYYSQLKDKNVSIMLGADITVEDSNATRIPVSEMVTKTVSGVILDKHKDDLNASELSYYYLDGSTWVDGGDVTDGGGVKLSDDFKLVPYVLVKKDDMQDSKTISVDGLSNIKNPVVVAKGKATTPAATLSKVLYSTLDTSSNIVLDAVTADSSEDSVTFKVPKGFDISEVVVIGEELNKITQGNVNSVKVDVENDQASITQEMNLIVSPVLKTQIETFLSENIADTFTAESFEMPYYGYASDATAQSDDKQKYYWIMGKNVKSFLEVGDNEFYWAEDVNATSTLEWSQDDNTTDEKLEYNVVISQDNKTVKEVKKYSQLSTGKLISTRTSTYGFDTPNMVSKTSNKTYSSNDITYGDVSQAEVINKSGSVYARDLTFNRVDENSTSVTVNNLSNTTKKSQKYYYEDTLSYSSTYNSSDSYKGTLTFKRGLYNSVESIITGKITQLLNSTYTSSDSYSSSSSYTTSKYINGLLELNSSDITFDGDSKYTSSTDSIEAHSYVSNVPYSLNEDKSLNISVSTGSNNIHTTTQSYLANIVKFDTNWLNGKTLYNVYHGQNGTWEMSSDTFTDTTVKSASLLGSEGSMTSDYNITSNGSISYFDTYENATEYISVSPTLSNNNYLTLCWGENENLTCTTDTSDHWFLDKTKATNKYYEEVANGSWTGTYTTSGGEYCESGTLNATIDGSYSYWQIQDGPSGSMYQNGNTITAKEYECDTYITVGTGTVNEAGTSITGTWTDDGCTGTFSLTK